MSIPGTALAPLGSPGCSAVTVLSPGHPRQPQPGSRACRGLPAVGAALQPFLLPEPRSSRRGPQGVTPAHSPGTRLCPQRTAPQEGLSHSRVPAQPSLLPAWVLIPNFRTFTSLGPFPYGVHCPFPAPGCAVPPSPFALLHPLLLALFGPGCSGALGSGRSRVVLGTGAERGQGSTECGQEGSSDLGGHRGWDLLPPSCSRGAAAVTVSPGDS